MGAAETRHDLWLKRVNTWIGIVGGSVASLVGAYNFIPSAPGNIAAVVREQSGTPVARAHVELLTSQNVLLGTSETDRNGRYAQKDLQPGNYILRVGREAFDPQITTVSVGSKKTTDLELVLTRRAGVQASTRARATSTSPGQGDSLRSALEETGASWIKNLAKGGTRQ